MSKSDALGHPATELGVGLREVRHHAPLDVFRAALQCAHEVLNQLVPLPRLERPVTLARLGHGVSLVLAMAREMDRGRRCEYRSLADPRPTRTLRMIWHEARYRSPLVEDFIQEMREAWGLKPPVNGPVLR